MTPAGVEDVPANLAMLRNLLDAAEALARESGKETVGLHVSGGNVAATSRMLVSCEAA